MVHSLFDTMGLLGRDLPNFYEMARHSLAPTLKIVDKASSCNTALRRGIPMLTLGEVSKTHPVSD
jgi:hypothetical protein